MADLKVKSVESPSFGEATVSAEFSDERCLVISAYLCLAPLLLEHCDSVSRCAGVPSAVSSESYGVLDTAGVFDPLTDDFWFGVRGLTFGWVCDCLRANFKLIVAWMYS